MGEPKLQDPIAADLYVDVAERIATLVADRADLVVPNCPDWTATDVVRHLTGLAADWLSGELEVYASAAWTDRQVDRRGADSLADVLAEWSRIRPAFADLLAGRSDGDHLPDLITTAIGPVPAFTFPGGVVVDATLHLLDLSEAAGVEPDLGPAAEFVIRQLVGSLRLVWGDRPSVRIRRVDARDHDIGTDPLITVAGSTIDVLATLGGRRRLDDMRYLDWSDPAAVDEIGPALVVPFFALPA